MAIYVDDIVISKSNKLGILELKTFLQTKFQIKDLRALKYFLGIEIAQGKKGFFFVLKKVYS